jgi:predicted nuclease of predicted toxin-antitoxin system
MKILIDMNLSPRWAEALKSRGIEAIHWSAIARADASDAEIMAYAEEHTCAVFTRDLDFGDLLAAAKAASPSVILVRADDVRPETMLDQVTETLVRYSAEIENGTFITITPHKIREHILPFTPKNQCNFPR